MKVIGLDLAGKEKNPTGFCSLVLKESEGEGEFKIGNKESKVLYYDKDILKEIKKQKPELVAIDAPFTFPGEGYFREGDKLLKERGFKPLSPRFPHMQKLVRRARKYLKQLEKLEIETIEVFPQATKEILRMKRKEGTNEHKFDAKACALTGKYYLEGKFEALGKEEIIIPKVE